MIKRRNLDNSLIQWIMTVTGLGPGIGEIQYMARPDSSTSRHAVQLANNNIAQGNVHGSLLLAEARTKGYRNDVILVTPGDYPEAARMAWDKNNTHILGLAGPNTGGDYYKGTGVNIYSTGVGVAEIIDVTADNCQFHGFTIGQFGNNLACKAALTLDGANNYFKHINFQGNMKTAQSQQADCCSVRIETDGDYGIFEDCTIGDDRWAIRNQATSGQLRMNVASGTTAPQGGTFRRCRFLSSAATNTVSMVYLASEQAFDRIWVFEDCTMHNHWVNWTTECLEVFKNANPSQTTCTVLLKDCVHTGYVEWASNVYGRWLLSNSPAPSTNHPGKAVEPTTS